MSQSKSKERVVIKIGTDLLTCVGGTLNRAFIEKMAGQIAALRQTGRYEVAVVTSGAVAAGVSQILANQSENALAQKIGAAHASGTLPEMLKDNLALKATLASIGQGFLQHAYTDAFQQNCGGQLVPQILLEEEHFKHVNACKHIQAVVDAVFYLDGIPIINENDTTAWAALRYMSNDILAAHFARLIEATRLVILSNIHGIFDTNPHENQAARLQRVIATGRYDGIETSGKSSGGTGGAGTKLAAATLFGGETVVAHGHRKHDLRELLDYGSGDHTVILPADGTFELQQQRLHGEHAVIRPADGTFFAIPRAAGRSR